MEFQSRGDLMNLPSVAVSKFFLYIILGDWQFSDPGSPLQGLLDRTGTFPRLPFVNTWQ